MGYIDDVRISGSLSLPSGFGGGYDGDRLKIYTDADGRSRSISSILAGKTIHFNLHDGTGFNNSGDANIDYVKIFVNGSLFYTHSESWWVNGDKKFTLPSSLTSWNVSSSYATTYNISVYFHFEDNKGSETESLGTIEFVDASFNDFRISTYPTKRQFYLNESFNYTGLVTQGFYYYRYSGTGEWRNITNPSVTTPDMSTTGSKGVTVSYGGRSVTYGISVYGISTYTFGNPQTTHLRKNVDTESSLFPLTLSITYGDDSTENQTINTINVTSVSKSDSQWVVNVSATALKTNETITTSYTINIEEVISLSLDNVPTKKIYSPNESIDLTGIVLKANYNNCNSYNVPINSIEVTDFDTTSVGDKNALLSYGGKSVTLIYYVDGMYSASVDLTNVNTTGTSKYYKTTYLYGYLPDIINDLSSILGRIRMTYTTRAYNSDGTYTDTTSIAPNNEISVTQDTPVKGNNMYVVTIVKNGITLTDNFNIKTYKYERLEIVNARSTVYSGINDTVQITPDLKVYGVDIDDNSKVELIYDETYSVSPVVGSTYSLGVNTVRFNSLENNVYADVNVNCVNDSPATGATITASGNLNKTAVNSIYYYSVGESIDLTGILLIISEMNSGLIDYTVTSDNYNKRLYRINESDEEVEKNTLTFDSNDIEGAYTLELTFGGLSVTYDIVLDYITSVSVDTSTSKLVYKSGETLDISTIYGTITYASGTTRNISDGDIASLTHTFMKEDTSDYDSETEDLELTICGIETEVTFTIICVKSAVINLTTTSYNIHDSLSIASVVVTYSDDTTTKTLNSDELNSITWVDGNNEFDITDMVFEDIRTTDEFTLDGTYSEGGISVNIEEDISIKALKEIKLVNNQTEASEIVVMDYNNTIIDVATDYFLLAVFNDDTTDSGITTISNIYSTNNSNINNAKLRDRTTCYSTYNWIVNNEIIDTMNCEFTIYCMKLVGLSLDWNSIDEQHYVGDTINMSSVTDIEASYSALISGEEDDEDFMRTETLTYSDLNYTINNQNVANFSYSFVESGTHTLVASYSPYTGDNRSETVTLSISVDDVELQSLSKTYTGETSFIEEQTLASELEDNLTVTAVYNNGSVELDFEQLSFYEKPDSVYVEFAINKRLTTSDNNKKIYAGFHDEYVEVATITVAAKELSGIMVVQQPEKTTFTIGDVITLKGMIVRATFDNGTTDLIDYNDVDITGVDTTNPITQIIEPLGRVATITYTYGGVSKTATVNLTLAYPKLKSLRINTAYVPTVYKDGDSFSATNLRVYGVFENGYEELLESTDYTIDVSDFTNNSVIAIPTNTETNKKEYGLTVIPVTATNPYDNTDEIVNDKDYKITLVGTSAIEQTWLGFDANTDYQNYNVGDSFTAKGLDFWVRDGESNEYKVNYTTNPAIGTILRSSQKIDVVVSFENTQSQTYTINVNVNYSDNNVNTIDYTIAIGDINGNLFTSINHGDTEIALGVKENGETIYPLFRKDFVSIDTNIAHTNTYGFNILNYQMSEAESRCIGYLDFGLQDEYGNVIKNAHVVLFEDYINPVSGDGNVTVKYPHYVEGEADKINNCKFGVIYNKHLFISGNEKYRNCDWHSESINVSQTENYSGDSTSDYTYFSDLDYCFYGTDDTAVIGYDIYRDGDLVVIKESSRTQATLYRREAKIITAIDSQGNKIEGYYEDAYPSFDINFNGGDGALSNRSIINFMGDTLFLTKNGLKVLSSKDTTYNKEKIVYDVSTYINPRIINENLKDAYLYTFKEKLLLKTNRGIYIGEYTLRNENNEYEWYFLDNIKADLFFEYDDELYFMNDDGELSKFSYNEKLFKDNARTFIGVGGTLLSIDEVNDYIIVSQEYNNSIKENNEFHLITTDENDLLIHANLGTFIEERERNRLAANDNSFNPLAYVGIIDDINDTIEIKRYNEDNEYDLVNTSKDNDLFLLNRYVYIDNIDGISIGNSPIANTPYKLVKVNDSVTEINYKYYLVNENTNERVSFAQTKSFRISFVISDGAVTRITNISDYGTGKKFQLIGDHNQILDLITYNNYLGSYKGVITNQDNVNSFYITKPYDMGTILYEKTIWQWAIVNDTELASYMDIGYLTSRKQGDYSLVIKTASGARAYSYDDSTFNFDKIQFTSDKLPHIYNRYRVLASVGFIRFLFKNFEDSNIVLDQLSLIYTISQSIKGVK